MPVFIEDVEYLVEDVVTTNGVPDFLKGNIFQKVTLSITFRSEDWVYFNTQNPLLFADPQFKDNSWLTDPVGQRLNKFSVGDVIATNDTSSNNTLTGFLIIEKFGNSLRLADLLGVPATLTFELATGPGKLNLIQDPAGIIYDYGLIENGEATNFISKVDGSLMRYSYGQQTAPLSNATLAPQGKKDWQLGTVTMTNTTTNPSREEFIYTYTIEQVFYIHPFYLLNQIDELTNDFPIAPKYWRHSKAIKHVFRIRAMRELQDPNVYQEGLYDEKDGETGWFDEQYNGGTARYTVADLNYNNLIDTIDPSVTNTVTFKINTNTDVLTGAAGRITLNFIVLPEVDNDYANRNQLMQENYCWDRVTLVCAASPTPANGEQFGTGYQVFSNATATQATNTCGVSVDITLGADVLAKLGTLSNGGFLIAAYATPFGDEATLADYTTVLVDVNEIDYSIGDGSLAITTDLLYHDQNDSTTVVTTPEFKVEDEIVADSLVLLDVATYPTAQIDFIKPQIIAKKTGEPDVILLEQEFNLQGNPLDPTVRTINESPTTPFNVNANEIRHLFKCYRSKIDDIGVDELAYRVQYPFLWRWEYWEAILLANLPAGWSDINEPNNGINNDWFRLQGLTGWGIYYNVAAQVNYKGNARVVETSTLLTTNDYDTVNDWGTPTFESFDGATQIDYSGDAYIMQNKQTTINASFTYTGGDPIDETDVYMVARLIPVENGTYIANETISSVYDRTFTGGLFIGDSDGKIVITENAGVFTGTFDLDYNSLPPGVLEYTLSVSIARNSTTGLTDYGNIHKEDLLVLEVLVPDPEVPKEENPFKKCCYPLVKLADTTDEDEFKNDISSPIFIVPLQYSITMNLQKYVGGEWVTQTVLNDNTYGTYKALGFETKNNYNYVGYQIEWRKVLDTGASGFGAGKYRVEFNASVISRYSEEWCLSPFSLSAADKTVRIGYTWNRLIGDANQKRTRDFVGLNWPKEIRLNDSIFGYLSAPFEQEDVKYETGELATVSKGFKSKYKMEIRQMPKEIQSIILNDVLMGDNITVTDYNSQNAGDYINVVVEIDGEFSPNYSDSRPNTDVELSFKSKYDNNNSYYS